MNEEKKEFLVNLIVTSLACLAPMGVGLFLFDKLPADLPMQYGLHGEVSWSAPKLVAILALPLFMTMVNMAMQVMLLKRPNDNPLNVKVKNLLTWAVAMIAVPVQIFMFVKPLNEELSVNYFCAVLSGLVFVILGNYLPKTTPNRQIGYRVPWIMENDEAWRKTNRLAGFMMVAAGLVILATGFTACFFPILVGTVLLMVLVPLVYSLVIVKKK